MTNNFVPDRRDEAKTPVQEHREGGDRRRFLRPTSGLKKKGLIFAAIFFAILCGIVAVFCQ
jgi:hypothetical protein